jgi:hypothetical protein
MARGKGGNKMSLRILMTIVLLLGVVILLLFGGFSRQRSVRTMVGDSASSLAIADADMFSVAAVAASSGNNNGGGVVAAPAPVTDKYTITGVVPIFMTTKDRLWATKKCIASYQKHINTKIHIVIYDTGTTYQATLDYFKELEADAENFTVMYNQKGWPRNAVGDVISAWMKAHPDSPYYVLTDPDIQLDPNGGDILEFYAHLLDTYDYPFAGPQLRINDVPKSYPLYNSLLERHTKYWTTPPEHTQFRGRTFMWVEAAKDTIFTMWKRDTVFKVRQKGVSTYAPYSAAHVDWYIDWNDLDSTPPDAVCR